MKLRHLIICILMLDPFSSVSKAQELADLLPDSLPGWRKNSTDKKYTTETLYDYIDGGAELYLSYGMNKVISRICQKENTGEIRIEIFDVVKSENAYGVFSHTRTDDENQYGQGSQYFTGALIFWKDHYYIAITSNDDNEEIRQAIRSFASQIDRKITTTGNIPRIVSYLPQERLQQNTYIYFHHYIWLNSHYYIADDNFLNIDENTQAVLARYGDKYNRINLLLIIYPDVLKAETAKQNFADRFLDKPGDAVTEIEDGTWLGAMSNGCLLACVFNAKSKNEAFDFLNKVVKQKPN
jgi:hypothetical protein